MPFGFLTRWYHGFVGDSMIDRRYLCSTCHLRVPGASIHVSRSGGLSHSLIHCTLNVVVFDLPLWMRSDFSEASQKRLRQNRIAGGRCTGQHRRGEASLMSFIFAFRVFFFFKSFVRNVTAWDGELFRDYWKCGECMKLQENRHSLTYFFIP